MKQKFIDRNFTKKREKEYIEFLVYKHYMFPYFGYHLIIIFFLPMPSSGLYASFAVFQLHSGISFF